MKLTTALFLVILSLPVFAQSQTEWINANIFFALQTRALVRQVAYLTPADFNKFKAEKIKSLEKIAGVAEKDDYANFDTSLTGIERIYYKSIIEFNENGSPVRFVFDSEDDFELTFSYDATGLMSGATLHAKNNSYNTEWKQQFIFTIDGGKVSIINSKNMGTVPDWLPAVTFEFHYRKDGSLETLSDPNHPTSFGFDEKNRLTKLNLAPSEYTWSYTQDGKIALITELSMHEEAFTTKFEYDKNGALISAFRGDSNMSTTFDYRNGPDGLPLTAREVFLMSGYIEDVTNYTYSYTKW